jgi:hypothetical protein
MPSGYYSHCGFNRMTKFCPLFGGNKSEESLEQSKNTLKYGVVSQKTTKRTSLVH